jgi:GxxExxY protein
MLDIKDHVRHAADRVMKELGPDHLDESVYDRALQIEFRTRGIRYESQPVLPISYAGQHVAWLQPDFYVHDIDDEAGTYEQVIVEVKTVRQLTEAERSQVRAYIRHSGAKRALLLNFAYDGTVVIEDNGGSRW